MTTRQAPADFHGRREVGLEVDVEQTGHADEGTRVLAFQGPEAVTVFIEVTTNAADQGGAFKACQRGGEIAHYLQVGAHGGELGKVVILPLAQHQACAFQFEYRGHARLAPYPQPAVYSVGPITVASAMPASRRLPLPG
ncbi:hypothetical protein D9M71_724560 [compost metagenome]